MHSISFVILSEVKNPRILPTQPQIRVPHLRDSFIVAKVGIREANRF
jgi:hypothetical protein